MLFCVQLQSGRGEESASDFWTRTPPAQVMCFLHALQSLILRLLHPQHL